MPRQASASSPVIHNRLAVLRAERGLSRQELADALGVNYQTIGYLERGEYNPSLDLALRAAEFFGLPVEADLQPDAVRAHVGAALRRVGRP